MSEQSVEIVRRHIEAYARGDEPEALSFLDDDVVNDLTRVNRLLGVSHGREAIDRAVRSFRGSFGEYTFELEDLTDVGGGTVVARIHESARGRGSGAPVDQTFAIVYTVIDGKIVRLTSFPTEREALAAVDASP